VGARDRWLLVWLGGHEYPGLADRLVTVEVNGVELGRVTVPRGWQEFRFWIPAALQRSGSLKVALETTPFVPAEIVGGEDDRLVGVRVSRVELVPLRTGLSRGWPAPGALCLTLLFSFALYVGLATWVLPPGGALGVGLLGAAVISWALVVHRLQVSAYLPRLAAGTFVAVLLTLATGYVARWLYRWSGVSLGSRDLRALQAIFLVGFWLKGWGLLYPTAVAIDLKWHLWQAQRIVQGELPALYRPGALSFWITPDQWTGGLESAVPYSPFYHITAAAFFFLPWPPYVTANLMSVLLDTSRAFLIYGLARKLGLGGRAGALAALLYGLLPATFLLHSWGNVPTTTGLWWALAATWYLVAGWEKLARWPVWLGLTFLLLGTMLYYSVTAAFITVLMILLLLGLWRSRTTQFRPLGAIGLALVVAIALAVAIYYRQYVPSLVALLRSGKLAAGVGSTGQPVHRFVWQTLVRLAAPHYSLLWPALLACAGLWVGRERLHDELVRWLTGSWFLTGLLFTAVDYRVQLVDKHVFFLMPIWCLWAGVALDWLVGRKWAGRAVVWLTYLGLAAASVGTWVYRLSYVQQEWTEIDVRIVGERLVLLAMHSAARLLGM
ncbi:MAG: hypothetical protein ACP5SI_12260, partial [Chloroflexia bacterium]